MHFNRTAFTRFIHFLNSNGICVLCRQKSGLNRDLCRPCEGDLPFLHPEQIVCRSCCLSLNRLETNQTGNAATLQCGECQKHPPDFHQTIAFMEYEHPINAMIQALKLRQEFQFLNVLCTLFGHYLIEHYRNNVKPEALIAVPLHRSKLVARGFNQSQMIANKLSTHLTIPVLNDYCLRHGSAKRQSGLSAQQRKNNLLDAFKLSSRGIKTLNQFSHVAIVDDVMTTGSTANELSKTLIQGGVERVDVFCLARTSLML